MKEIVISDQIKEPSFHSLDQATRILIIDCKANEYRIEQSFRYFRHLVRMVNECIRLRFPFL